MAKYYDVEQHSDEWDRLRLGIPTASSFSKIITANGKPSKQWESLAYHLIAERMLGRKVDTYTSPAMDRGNLFESDAADWYENVHHNGKIELKRIGFVSDDNHTMGCSPDRLIGDDGILEVKCPQPQTQVRYLITGELEDDYKPQIQGQLYITEREYVDIIAWHPELTRTVITVERDEVFIACLAQQLKEFNQYIESVMVKIESLTRKNFETTLLAG